MKRWLLTILVSIIGYLPTQSSSSFPKVIKEENNLEMAQMKNFECTMTGYNYLKSTFDIQTLNIPNGCPLDLNRFNRMSDRFGYRMHPIYNRVILHTGIDFSGERGADVYATGDGVVENVSYMRGYGKIVVINHGNGITTRYAHLSSHLVKKGDNVIKGDIIGKLGSTGRSTGPHLHYEVRIKGRPINPMLLYTSNVNIKSEDFINILKNNYYVTERCIAYN